LKNDLALPSQKKDKEGKKKERASMVTKAEYLDSIAIRWLWSIPFLVTHPLNFLVLTFSIFGCHQTTVIVFNH
jgi:hypothetical protein